MTLDRKAVCTRVITRRDVTQEMKDGEMGCIAVLHHKGRGGVIREKVRVSHRCVL